MNQRWISRVAGLLLVGAAAAQQVTIEKPAPPTTHAADVDAEFAELLALLDELGRDFGASRKFCAPDPASVLAGRLAVFERRFGLEPRAARGWPSLRARASEVLFRARGRGLPETAEVQDVSSQMDRWILLDILGRRDEADAILRSVRTLGSDACVCCTAENTWVVSQRRSEDAERRGDLAAALEHAGQAALDVPILDDCTQWLPGVDILSARHGLLLLAAGRLEAGLLRLQALARSRPESVGGGLARAELELRGASAGIGAARFLVGGVGEIEAAAVWSVDDPASMQWVAARRHLGRRDFEALLPAEWPGVRAELAEGVTSIDLLTLLDGLPGGAEPAVDAYLLALVDNKASTFAEAARTDERLRWMHGGGPELRVSLGYCNWRSLSEDWRAWRRKTGARAVGPR